MTLVCSAKIVPGAIIDRMETCPEYGAWLLQKKAEFKVQKVQERAEAERKAKAEKTKEWHKQQHEREQARLQVSYFCTSL